MVFISMNCIIIKSQRYLNYKFPPIVSVIADRMPNIPSLPL
jgi:hypothetical protein